MPRGEPPLPRTAHHRPPSTALPCGGRLQMDSLLVHEVPGWLHPVAAAPCFLDLPSCAVLDSSLADGTLGRYSYLSADPPLRLHGRPGALLLTARGAAPEPLP